jgi:hypothetical protein
MVKAIARLSHGPHNSIIRTCDAEGSDNEGCFVFHRRNSITTTIVEVVNTKRRGSVTQMHICSLVRSVSLMLLKRDLVRSVSLMLLKRDIMRIVRNIFITLLSLRKKEKVLDKAQTSFFLFAVFS